MHITNYIYRILIYTNILIALASIAQCALTYLILDLPIRPNILLIEGCATLMLYNFSLYLSKPSAPRLSPYPRTRWVFEHEWILWTLSILSFALFMYAVFQMHLYVFLFLGFLGAVSLIYGLPLYMKNGKKVGFRQIPGLKLFHIAFVWSLSTVGLPVIDAWTTGLEIDWYMVNYLGIVKMLFLVVCTLPFDVRDMQQDFYYDLRTIPNLIGRKRAIYLNYALLLAHTVLICFAPYSFHIKTGLLATNMIVFGLMHFTIFNRIQRYNTVYLLDIALIIQWLLVLLVHNVI